MKTNKLQNFTKKKSQFTRQTWLSTPQKWEKKDAYLLQGGRLINTNKCLVQYQQIATCKSCISTDNHQDFPLHVHNKNHFIEGI